MRTLPVLLFAVAATTAYPQPRSFAPDIPKVWDDEAMVAFELPLATPEASPKHVPADYYYRIPVRTIYKSYPSSVMGRDPAEYRNWLKQQEPEILFDVAKLRTKEDWIQAGKIVFEAPAVIGRPELGGSSTYVVRAKGNLEAGGFSCAGCHSRRLDSGKVVPGAQFYANPERIRRISIPPGYFQLKMNATLFATPWLKPDPNTSFVSEESLALAVRSGLSTGVFPRMGTSNTSPVQIPDLVGVKDMRYLDHTGLQRHRTIADLMRYAATNQGDGYMQAYSRYGDFLPAGELPNPTKLERFSDQQLYALALYIYSLQPPSNPNKFDDLATRGQKVFEREGCGTCHTPPLYTNNKLTPASGFEAPEDHKRKYDILPVVVGTDPYVALKTRRGTGYYKVPSLRGVWYRGPFEHNGSVMTLEDWFDEHRLREDYVPTGWVGPSKTRAVRGHEYGLRLPTDEKRALIAFLKTL